MFYTIQCSETTFRDWTIKRQTFIGYYFFKQFKLAVMVIPSFFLTSNFNVQVTRIFFVSGGGTIRYDDI